jgi:hypothetical protein
MMTDEPKTLYVTFGTTSEAYLIRFMRSGSNFTALKAVLRRLSLPTYLKKLWGEFLQILSSDCTFEDICDTLSLETFYPLADEVRFIQMSNFESIVGSKLKHGSDLYGGINFLFDFHAKTQICLITSVIEEQLPCCIGCRRYYKNECSFCSRKSFKMTFPDPEIKSDDEEVLFTEIPRSNVENDNAVYIVYTFDLETFTDSESFLHPIMCCVSIFVYAFNCYAGGHFLKRDNFLSDAIFKKIEEVMTSCGFVYVGSKGGMHNIPDSLGFLLVVSPDNVDVNKIGTAIVMSQNHLFNNLSSPEFQSQLESFYSDKFNGCLLDSFMLISSSYNGHKFDELLILEHRLYAEANINSYEFFLKAGAVYRMNRFSKIKQETKSIQVRLKLFDLLRFWANSLRNVARSLELPVKKGDMSFELINHIYNKYTKENYKRFPEELLFSYEPYKSSEAAKDEVKQYSKNGYYDFIELLFEYCMMDVVVTELATKVMLNSVLKLCDDLKVPKLCIFNKIGIPAVGKQLFLNYTRLPENNDEIIYAPQRWVMELVRKSIIGGRSEIQVNGLLKEKVYVIDVTSMYPVCMTAKFPKGEGCIPSMDDFKMFQAFLDRNRGEIHDLGVAYDEVISDYGFLIAYCDISPPVKLLTFAPLAYHTKIGLAWSNEARCQPMTSQDMENLTRLGWSVTIKTFSPAIMWTEGSYVMKEFVEFFGRARKAAVTADEKNFLKLIANSLYGKLLENVVSNKYKFVSHNESAQTRYLPNMSEFKSSSEKKGDTWNSVSPIFDPYKKDTVCDVFLVNFTENEKPEDFNKTPAHNGAFCLSYSRTMCIHIMNLLEDRDEEDFEKKKPSFFASETDSFHISEEMYKRFPEWFFADKMGAWNQDKKCFDFYCKVEIVGREAMYFSKKFYFIVPEDENEKPKYACKGLPKDSLTYETLFTCLHSVFFSPEEQTLYYAHGSRITEVGKMTMKRACIGSFTSPSEPLRSNIKTTYLSRKVMPTFHLKRPIDGLSARFFLSDDFLKLRPFDVKHPINDKDKIKGEEIKDFIFDHVFEDCDQELCPSLEVHG